MQDVDEAAAAGVHGKRRSLELPEDLLHIKPYVNLVYTLIVIVFPVLTVNEINVKKLQFNQVLTATCIE